MSTKRLLAWAVFGTCLMVAVAAGPAIATAAATPSSATLPTLPQVSSAQQGATWLAAQLTPGGYILSTTTPGESDLGSTANAVLALASAGIDPAGAQSAIGYLETQVNSYVTVDGSDGPGQLALLILDAHVLGVDPRSFGGTDLVSRLLATEQTSGPDAGLFGVQDPTYDGAYRQGLSLAALAAVGVTDPSQVGSAESWLEAQQCPDGGWTSYITDSNPCDGDPASYEGPDTNSTALAVEGLAVQGALGPSASANALSFITGAQDSDGGWGYEPNSSSAPGSTDPDSTALVIQAILALGQSPSATVFQRGSSNPVFALLSFQLGSGSGVGAFFYPGSSGPDLLATYQAVPAAAAVVFPFAATTTSATVNPTSVTDGATVTYRATVTSPGAAPTGVVTFASGSTALCATPELVDGLGSCTAANAPVASGQTVTATYTGVPDFGLSTGTALLTVSPATSSATIGPTTAASTGASAVAGATTVHTGEDFAGSEPYVVILGGVGFGLVSLGALKRRRTRVIRGRA